MTIEGITITDADYKERLARANGLLIFYKKLCPNCKALEKVLQKFLAAKPDVQCVRIDSEECPDAMKAYDTELVPTLLVMKEGQVAARKVGLMNLREMIDFYQSAC